MNNLFSYSNYKRMISDIQKFLPILDFSNITDKTEKYCVIRHDIEFSMERALLLAKIENSIEIISTYCVQLRNNNYNPISEKNVKIMNEIINLGHHIGLHVHLDNFLNNPLNGIYKYIKNDCKILSNATNININRFSIHRPTKTFLLNEIKIKNIINLNGKLFFNFTDKPINKENLKVIYLADSEHQWKYGHPMNIDFQKYSKIQLNCHPFSWTENGYNNLNNMIELIKEKRDITIESIKNEYKTFPNSI